MSVDAPLVSVITIFLNEERFLGEAIESVLAQRYDAWELLLVDDGSSDGSSGAARSYAQRHPERIRYLEHPGHANRGMSASRNLGLLEAKGEYVTFLDADDVFVPEKLDEQVAILEAHPEVAMVYGQALIWHSWTGRVEDAQRDYRYELGVEPNRVIAPPTLFFLLLENAVQSPMTGNSMVRRSVLQKIGGYEESFRGMYEDQVLFFKIDLDAPVFVSDACWMKYRQHDESCVAQGRAVGDYYSRRRPLLEWLHGHLIARGVPRASPVRRAVSRQLWRARHPLLRRVAERMQAIARGKRRAQAAAR